MINVYIAVIYLLNGRLYTLFSPSSNLALFDIQLGEIYEIS